MTSQPNPPYPYPPYGQGYRPPVDWSARCKRAGILMFVIGMLVGLYGIANFALIYNMSADEYMRVSQQSMQGIGGAQQPQISPDKMRTLGMGVSAIIVVVGLTFMILTGPVRRGGKGAQITGLVISGLIGGLMGLMVLLFGIMGLMAPPMLIVACCMAVPLGILTWLFIWLLQAYRAVGAAEQMAAMMTYGQQQAQGSAHPQQPTTPYPPAGYPGYPPYGGYPQQPGVQPPAPGNTFGHAPFGIPPPPDQGGGKYGYATKPPDEPKPERKDDGPRTE